MKSWVLRIADKLSASYWFAPAIMAVAAVLLAGGMIFLDTRLGSAWMDHAGWLYAARPDGARQMLMAIGGSMITVAGTVFSVTIAAVVYASGQYGPRLLTNFMRDRGNQVTLGTFLATFLYCLIVLRTIRSADESGGYGFVPNLALLVAIVLAICSIAVLIFFIHHVPSKIHINSVIQDVGERLIHQVAAGFPRCVAASEPSSEDEAETGHPIVSAKTGYLQFVNVHGLVEVARKAEITIYLRCKPGDFTHVGRELAIGSPVARWDDGATHAIRAAFSIGARRSAFQDPRFLIDELVEIAARALSPGVNDPYTAVTCMDWLGAALADVAQGDPPSPIRTDAAGAARVVETPETFKSLVDRGLGALVQYVARDTIAALRFIQVTGEIARCCDRPERVAAVMDQIDRLEALAAEALPGFDARRLSDRAGELRRAHPPTEAGLNTMETGGPPGSVRRNAPSGSWPG